MRQWEQGEQRGRHLGWRCGGESQTVFVVRWRLRPLRALTLLIKY